jgi:hypothetical protein
MAQFFAWWAVKSNYFERNQSGSCLFNIGTAKFLFAASGIFPLHWRRFYTVHASDD